jgi:hypothetical protein
MHTLFRRRCVAVVAAVVSAGLLAGLPAGLPAHAAQLKFSQRTIASSLTVGEPRVFADKDPSGVTHTYVVAPLASTTVWSSTDGSHWKMAATAGGGGDSDLAIDANHTVWADDLLDGSAASTTIPISTSTNYGQSFKLRTTLAPHASGVTYDRPWLAASGLPVVASALSAGALSAADINVWRIDATSGRVTGPKVVASNVDVQGPMIALPRGGFAVAYEGLDAAGTDTAIVVADSKDGVSWSTHQVADHEVAHLFPVIAADASNGSRDVAWSGDVIGTTAPGGLFSTGGATEAVKFATQPSGHAWSKPQVLSDIRLDALQDNRPAVFPWVVAGGGGVDVTYAIATQHPVNPPGVGGLPGDLGSPSNFGGPTTTWDLLVAQSFNPGAASSWTRTVIAGDFHTGSICVGGLETCPGPQQLQLVNLPTPFDRRELDFIGAGLDPAGNLLVPFGKDTPSTDLLFPDVNLTLARQAGGPAL